MWERICENEATLPLFDEDYKFDDPTELFKPVTILTSQTNEVRLCDQSLALWKRTKAPLRGVPHKNGRPSLEELKELFWAEELQNPPHYGGDNPYETIKVLGAWLSYEEFKGFCKGNAIKYLSRAGKKDDELEDLQKARWYCNKLIELHKFRTLKGL